MGIVNVTPDSFSDGGTVLRRRACGGTCFAIGSGRERRFLDIGGESTRPGAQPVEADEELRRVVPVIEKLASSGDRSPLD